MRNRISNGNITNMNERASCISRNPVSLCVLTEPFSRILKGKTTCASFDTSPPDVERHDFIEIDSVPLAECTSLVAFISSYSWLIWSPDIYIRLLWSTLAICKIHTFSKSFGSSLAPRQLWAEAGSGGNWSRYVFHSDKNPMICKGLSVERVRLNSAFTYSSPILRIWGGRTLWARRRAL